MQKFNEISFYHDVINNIIKQDFYLEVEDLEESKIIIINLRLLNLKESYKPKLVINIDLKTGKAKGYSRNKEFIKYGKAIKYSIEEAFKQEKMRKMFKNK